MNEDGSRLKTGHGQRWVKLRAAELLQQQIDAAQIETKASRIGGTRLDDARTIGRLVQQGSTAANRGEAGQPESEMRVEDEDGGRTCPAPVQVQPR